MTCFPYWPFGQIAGADAERADGGVRRRAAWGQLADHGDHATGVSDLIEVTSADAAANPELASMSFPVTATGVTGLVDDSGNLTATDGEGNQVFSAAAPQMWDSEAADSDNGGDSGDDGQPPADRPEAGDAQAVVPVTQGTDAATTWSRWRRWRRCCPGTRSSTRSTLTRTGT